MEGMSKVGKRQRGGRLAREREKKERDNDRDSFILQYPRKLLALVVYI